MREKRKPDHFIVVEDLKLAAALRAYAHEVWPDGHWGKNFFDPESKQMVTQIFFMRTPAANDFVRRWNQDSWDKLPPVEKNIAEFNLARLNDFARTGAVSIIRRLKCGTSFQITGVKREDLHGRKD